MAIPLREFMKMTSEQVRGPVETCPCCGQPINESDPLADHVPRQKDLPATIAAAQRKVDEAR